MTSRLVPSLLAVATLSLPARIAAAVTCDFDESSGELSVPDLQGSATLEVVGGAIELDGAPCGTATTTSTARIVIVGRPSVRNEITLIGTFAPGRNDVPEADTPEIEFELVAFDDWNDRLVIVGSDERDVWRFTALGINLNGDLDQDINTPAGGQVSLSARGGQDTIDASAYAGTSHLSLRGSAGDDQITGSTQGDDLFGGAGNDTLHGRGGSDWIRDGTGDDLVRGGPGDDVIQSTETAANGADDIRGNNGSDSVAYSNREIAVTVTIDGAADDGQAGEGDNVHADVENVTGGRAGDILVGSGAANRIDGSQGDDEIHGGGGDDILSGGMDTSGGGGDIIMGEGGNDVLQGWYGHDFLHGGAGDDRLEGGNGNDTLDGGVGVDLYLGGAGADVIYNADAEAETVDCGGGVDDPEPSALDTFIGCEN